jgi:hypothetical protein
MSIRWAIIRAAQANQLVLYLALVAGIVTGLAAFSPHPFMPDAKLFGVLDLPRLVRVAQSRASRGIGSGSQRGVGRARD